MKYIYCFCLSFLSIIVFSSCVNESDATKVTVLLKSGEITQYAQNGSKILVSFQANAIESSLDKIKITSFDGQYGNVNLFDTTLNVSSFTHDFVYTVPSFSEDSVTVNLKITASDQNGNSGNLNLKIISIGGAQQLTEYTGIVMYSAASARACAFSFSNPTNPFIIITKSDSLKADVYDYLPAASQSESLFREWRSLTETKFVKVANFNYAAATSVTVNQTYLSLVKLNTVDDIKINDVILVGHGNTAKGAIMITDVVDQTGTANDFYRFNFKVVK